jgi:hypothetical protein
MKHLQHTSKTSETLETYGCNNSTQHLVAAWENGGSLACGVHRRQRPDGACRLRNVGGGCATRQQGNARTLGDREPDSPGSHWCGACRAGPPVAGAVGAVVPPYQGLLMPSRRGPLMLRSHRGRACSCQGRCVGTLPCTATREKWKE